MRFEYPEIYEKIINFIEVWTSDKFSKVKEEDYSNLSDLSVEDTICNLYILSLIHISKGERLIEIWDYLFSIIPSNQYEYIRRFLLASWEQYYSGFDKELYGVGYNDAVIADMQYIFHAFWNINEHYDLVKYYNELRVKYPSHSVIRDFLTKYLVQYYIANKDMNKKYYMVADTIVNPYIFTDIRNANFYILKLHKITEHIEDKKYQIIEVDEDDVQKCVFCDEYLYKDKGIQYKDNWFCSGDCMESYLEESGRIN